MATTTARVLRLLMLLQSRPVWTGPELSERLGVTDRTVRRDVGRLRELGYPVQAAHGTGGGYQLGSGRALPPLLLDDDEAVAIVASLRLVAGTDPERSELVLRTLAKLDQVLPARIRAKVQAVSETTAALGGATDPVKMDLLLALAGVIRAYERVRFHYTTHAGHVAERTVEPYHVVAAGRHWYLVAFDPGAPAPEGTDAPGDWRTLRLDRMDNVEVLSFRFRPRPGAPDPLTFVQRAIAVAPYRWTLSALVAAPAEEVERHVYAAAVQVEKVDQDTCRIVSGNDHLHELAYDLVRLPFDVRVEDPPELVGVMREMADRLSGLADRAT